MTNAQIKAKLANLSDRLRSIREQEESTLLEIKQTQGRCTHGDRKKWTNDDGDGQFTVERCNICGKQKDGGLG